MSSIIRISLITFVFTTVIPCTVFSQEIKKPKQLQTIIIQADTTIDRMPVVPLPDNEMFKMPVMVPDSTVTFYLKIQGMKSEKTDSIPSDQMIIPKKKK